MERQGQVKVRQPQIWVRPVPQKPAGTGESPAGLVASSEMCDTQLSQGDGRKCCVLPNFLLLHLHAAGPTSKTRQPAALLLQRTGRPSPPGPSPACSLRIPPSPRLKGLAPQFPVFCIVNRSRFTSLLASLQPSLCWFTPPLLCHTRDRTSPRPPVTARPPDPVTPVCRPSFLVAVHRADRALLHSACPLAASPALSSLSSPLPLSAWPSAVSPAPSLVAVPSGWWP